MISRRAKILHFIDSGGVYGAESVLLNLSEQMAASGRYEPVVGCIVSHTDEASDLFDKARSLGLRAEKIAIRNGLLWLDLPRAAYRLHQMGVDLIHSHGYKPSVFGFVIKILTGIEVMATCHLWFKGTKGPLKMRAMVAVELFLYRFFRIVVGVSQPIKDVLSRSGVDPERIQVIKNGVNVDNCGKVESGTIAALRQELRLESGTYCVLNTGRLTPQKAQVDIVAAARILRDQGLNLRVLIVGEGELQADLCRQVNEEGLAEIVTLLGFRDDVVALLELADLYVLPSLDEGMPMGLLEAVAAGVPVVATAVGDVPDLVENRVSGLIVPPGQPTALAAAIAEQVSNRKTAKLWSKVAAARVRERYSNVTMFAAYDGVYRTVLGGEY